MLVLLKLLLPLLLLTCAVKSCPSVQLTTVPGLCSARGFADSVVGALMLLVALSELLLLPDWYTDTMGPGTQIATVDLLIATVLVQLLTLIALI